MNPNTTCYYCNRDTSESQYLHIFKMYHILSSDIGIGLTGIKKTTHYYERKIAIDRCDSCYKIHKNASQPALVIASFCSIVGAILGWYFGKRWYIALVAAAITFVVVLIMYFQFIYRHKIKKLNIKDQFEIHDHPIVKTAMENGWQLTKI